jgi:hypothetical protein
MTVTLSYDTALARVQLAATGLPGTAARVERSLNGILWTTVRGGMTAPVTAGAVNLDDYEFVSDRLNYYRVTPLNFTADFESGVTGWEGIGGTLSASTAQEHSGTGSALITPDGVTADVRVATTLAASPPVVAGTTYDLSVWAYHDLGRDLELSVRWFNASDVQVSWPSGPTFSVPADTWTRLHGSFTAPATAVKGKIHISQGSTPSAANLLYVDDVVMTGVVHPSQQDTITPSLGDRIWLKSIRWPFLNRAVTVTEFSEIARPSRAGVFDVRGRSVPVTVGDTRGSQRFTLQLRTDTLTAARDMDLVLAAGGTMFVHVPANCPVPGGYVEIGDTGQSRRTRSARSDRRYVDLPCTVVAAPGPDVVGGTMTWGTVLALYGDWTNLVAANPTWSALLAGVASPEDLVTL